jgi:hypothetical protein
VEKVAKKWGTSAIFCNCPKVNNHPLGENSPNLATLEEYRQILKIAENI